MSFVAAERPTRAGLFPAVSIVSVSLLYNAAERRVPARQTSEGRAEVLASARPNGFASLEKQLQAELNQARIARFENLSEGCIRKVAVRIVELRVIEQVVKLGAQLRGKPLVDAGLLGNDHVRFADGRAAA
jgi:hypothetical protein